MQLALVIGNVVATIKDSGLAARTLLVLQIEAGCSQSRVLAEPGGRGALVAEHAARGA